MRMRWVLVVVPVLLIGADAPKDDAAKKELEKFQGTWQLVSAETDGKVAPEEQVKQTRVVIKGSVPATASTFGLGTNEFCNKASP